MSRPQALANKSVTAVLGALGRGAGGGETTNNLSQINAAPIGPAATNLWNSSPFVSATGRVLVVGYANANAAGGTLAAGDALVGNIVRDSATNISASCEVAAAAAGGVAQGTVFAWMIDTVTPGVSHVWGIQVAAGGGHTATIPISGANITVIDV